MGYQLGYILSPSKTQEWSGVRRRTFVVRRSQYSNIFVSETTWPIKAKFYVEPPWVGGTNFCLRHVDHMTKMAATPISDKKPFKNLLRNRWTYFDETWCVASGIPGLTLTYFTALSNFVGKRENSGFFRNNCSQ